MLSVTRRRDQSYGLLIPAQALGMLIATDHGRLEVVVLTPARTPGMMSTQGRVGMDVEVLTPAQTLGVVSLRPVGWQRSRVLTPAPSLGAGSRRWDADAAGRVLIPFPRSTVSVIAVRAVECRPTARVHLERGLGRCGPCLCNAVRDGCFRQHARRLHARATGVALGPSGHAAARCRPGDLSNTCAVHTFGCEMLDAGSPRFQCNK